MPSTRLRYAIQPQRRLKGRIVPCTFDEAQRYAILRNGTRVTTFNRLADARAYIAMRSTQTLSRSRDAILGCRYSEVREEVAARGAASRPPLARSLTQEQYNALHGDDAAQRRRNGK